MIDRELKMNTDRIGKRSISEISYNDSKITRIEFSQTACDSINPFNEASMMLKLPYSENVTSTLRVDDSEDERTIQYYSLGVSIRYKRTLTIYNNKEYIYYTGEVSTRQGSVRCDQFLINGDLISVVHDEHVIFVNQGYLKCTFMKRDRSFLSLPPTQDMNVALQISLRNVPSSSYNLQRTVST